MFTNTSFQNQVSRLITTCTDSLFKDGTHSILTPLQEKIISCVAIIFSCILLASYLIKRSFKASPKNGSEKLTFPDVNGIVSIRLQEARKTIIVYQHLLEKIQMFIANHPDLQQLCEKYIAKDHENIAPIHHIDSFFDHNDEIETMTQARIAGNNLRHIFEEFVFFIRRNDEVAKAFETYIAADPSALEMFQKYRHLVPQE